MRFFFLVLSLGLLTSCSSTTSRRDPGVDFKKFTRYYVEHRLNDNHATDAMIAVDLRARGLEVGHGPLTMMPETTEVLVTYDARWTWDFRSYLINLEITAHQVRTEKMIATGTYHHPGLTPKAPEKMIHSLLNRLLN